MKRPEVQISRSFFRSAGSHPNYFSLGQAFERIGGYVHRALNLGTEEAEEYNMSINP